MVGYHAASIAGAPTFEKLIEAVISRLPLADTEAVSVVMVSMAVARGDRVHLGLNPAIKVLITEKSGKSTWAFVQKLAGSVGIVRVAYSSVLSNTTADRMYVFVRWPYGLEKIPNAGHDMPLEQSAALVTAVSRPAWRFASAT